MNKAIDILCVEDDSLQAEWIRQTVEREIRAAKVTVIRTESEFVEKFNQIRTNPPALILMDVMLRWADPSPDMPPRPPEVKAGGMQRAGLRCQARLAAHPGTKAIPVILLTVLRNAELRDLDAVFAQVAANVSYLEKDSNPARLLREIRRLTRRGKAEA